MRVIGGEGSTYITLNTSVKCMIVITGRSQMLPSMEAEATRFVQQFLTGNVVVVYGGEEWNAKNEHL